MNINSHLGVENSDHSCPVSSPGYLLDKCGIPASRFLSSTGLRAVKRTDPLIFLLYAWACAEGVRAFMNIVCIPHVFAREGGVGGKLAGIPFAEPSCGICECMHTHLMHLCSLPAVMRCCARLLPWSHLPHPALLGLSSSPRSFINPRCAGCGASHTVSTFFCHSQLFSDFPNTTRSPPLQPLSVSLPPFPSPICHS